MPRRLWAALAVLGLLLLFMGRSIIVDGANPLNTVLLVVAVAALLQLPQGHPLARQCGLLVAALLLFCGAAAVPMTTFLGLRALLAASLLLGTGALLAWALSGPAVRRYFSLYCHACGSYRTHAIGLLFRRVGCRECGREWRRTELLDPSIFE